MCPNEVFPTVEEQRLHHRNVHMFVCHRGCDHAFVTAEELSSHGAMCSSAHRTTSGNSRSPLSRSHRTLPIAITRQSTRGKSVPLVSKQWPRRGNSTCAERSEQRVTSPTVTVTMYCNNVLYVKINRGNKRELTNMGFAKS